MDQFNHLIQNSTENTTCQLHSEMSRLVCLYASNLLKHEVIIAASNNLAFLNFANNQQLADENLGLGTDTWAHISQLEEDFDPKPFDSAVRHFM